MTNPMSGNLADPDGDGTDPRLSDFIEEAAGALLEETEYGENGMTVETMTISLPVECRVEMEEGRPSIRIMAPRRTETTVKPVLHRLTIRVDRDADL